MVSGFGQRFSSAGEGSSAITVGNTSSILADGKSPSSAAAAVVSAVVCCVPRGLLSSLRWEMGV